MFEYRRALSLRRSKRRTAEFKLTSLRTHDFSATDGTSKISGIPLSCLARRIQVAIVDDDETDRSLTRKALIQTPGVEFVKAYGSGEEALKGIPGSGADVVLMDIRMPGMDGTECTRQLKRRMPRLRIIMTTGLLDTQWMIESRRAGADGYLTKPVSPAQVLAWITWTYSSGSRAYAWAEPPPADQSSGSAGNSSNLMPLNSRENAVADLVSQGYRDKEIAHQLGLSVCVVENLVKNIRRKLNASNRAQVASLFRFHPVALSVNPATFAARNFQPRPAASDEHIPPVDL
jgi:DNA-binding NarL/FixJ family response regulator